MASYSVKVQKPASSYNDTLPVGPLSVVFFRPDSVQLGKLEDHMEKTLFEATMHDYFFQVKYAKRFMDEHFKNVRILDVDRARFLLFKGYRRTFLVDLDTYESNGMLVFDGVKAPELIDMTNVATQVSDYFQ